MGELLRFRFVKQVRGLIEEIVLFKRSEHVPVFSEVLSQAEAADLLSKEHFSVDGTLIEALASH
ncbi:MAG: hypothetical protein ABW072_14830, partial [Sedimenticola sp.]